jgi:phosphatidate phosphatase APP1
MVAEIYHAIRHERGVSVKGRVLLARTWPHPGVDDPGLVNLYHMLRRWCTPERPYSLVRLSAGGAAVEKRSDREGYFEFEFPASEAPGDELLIELPESEVSPPARWPIEVLASNPRFIVLSDVDDTVLVTHAGKLFRMITTTLFGNALTRQLFPGVVELYSALRRGGGDGKTNPLAYVTSSPFNLHGLLELVFRENGMPFGPCFMTDWGLDEDKWLKRGHHEHKLEAIHRVFSWYPDKPAIFFGDTSQLDVPIYVEAALDYPGRVPLIFIHKVSAPKRIAFLGREAEPLAESETALHFINHYGEAAAILAEAGWITAEERDIVIAAATAERPSFPERVMQRLNEESPTGSPPSDGR